MENCCGKMLKSRSVEMASDELQWTALDPHNALCGSNFRLTIPGNIPQNNCLKIAGGTDFFETFR